MPKGGAQTLEAPKANAARASAGQRILIVEDDAAVRRLLRALFEEEGYEVIEARTQTEVIAALAAHDISLITLDLSLAGEDGLAIAREVRRRCSTPIVMLTAKGEIVDRIVGLEIGADDYIAKPFNVREVLARVRAVLRRGAGGGRDGAGAPASDVFEFSGYVFDTGKRHLETQDARVIELTSGEFRLLDALVRRPQRVLSRDQLLDLVAGTNADLLERAIDTLVGRLRRKIETGSGKPALIKTVRGGGYVFSAKVRQR